MPVAAAPIIAEMEAQRRIRELPSLKELINITATLAIGSKRDSQNLSILIEQAFQLWEACSYHRKQKIDFITLRAKARAQDLDRENKIPKPKKYPITFDEFLRLTIGGRYRDRRVKIYRAYAKEMIRWGHVNQLVNHPDPTKRLIRSEAEAIAVPASLSELESWMGMTTKSTFNNENDYGMAARAFLLWLSEQPSERGRNAALKRWNKKRQEKQAFKELY